MSCMGGFTPAVSYGLGEWTPQADASVRYNPREAAASKKKVSAEDKPVARFQTDDAALKKIEDAYAAGYARAVLAADRSADRDCGCGHRGQSCGDRWEAWEWAVLIFSVIGAYFALSMCMLTFAVMSRGIVGGYVVGRGEPPPTTLATTLASADQS